MKVYGMKKNSYSEVEFDETYSSPFTITYDGENLKDEKNDIVCTNITHHAEIDWLSSLAYNFKFKVKKGNMVKGGTCVTNLFSIDFPVPFVLETNPNGEIERIVVGIVSDKDCWVEYRCKKELTE